MKLAHLQTWSGSKGAEVIDMTNAGKRGKTCEKTITWTHCAPDALGDQFLELFTPELVSQGYDAISAAMYQAAATWAKGYNVETRTIRGIDAPVKVLTAGIPGKWSATADNDGLHLRDLADQYNEWTEITIRQSNPDAYRRAAKVWPQVQAAQTMHEARSILEAAGCRLHGFCAMD